MTIRAFMVRPDSQIKASGGPGGPAVRRLDCYMLRAFHRLGKALPGTWQAGLFPELYCWTNSEQEWGILREWRRDNQSPCIWESWESCFALIHSNCCLLAAPRSVQKVLGREVPKNTPTLKPLYSTWAVKPLTRCCVFPFSLQEHNQARGHSHNLKACQGTEGVEN